MTFGVLPTGFVLKSLVQILTDIESDELATIAPDLDISPQNPLGQLNGIYAAALSDLWELAQFLYNNTNRGAAQGDQLDNIGTLEGTIREGPTPTTVFVELGFNAVGASPYPAGALVAFVPQSPGVKFQNAVTVTVPALVGGNPISIANPYLVTDILFESLVDGPSYGETLLAYGQGNLTGMVPVTGWEAVSDIGPPTLGTLEELDPEYRIRQVRELSDVGSSSVDAIEAQIEKALTTAPQPVAAPIVIVYENTTMFLNALGIPPKAFMAVVYDGSSPNIPQDNPIIAAAIWKNKPAGIATFGSTTLTTPDSQGNLQTVSFSRATVVPVYMTIVVAISQTASPAAVQSLVEEAIITASQGKPFLMFGQEVVPAPDSPTTLLPGKDVIGMAFRAVALGQAGVLDVPSLTLDIVPNPTATANIRMGPTQIAQLGTLTVTVQTQTFVP